MLHRPSGASLASERSCGLRQATGRASSHQQSHLLQRSIIIDGTAVLASIVIRPPGGAKTARRNIYACLLFLIFDHNHTSSSRQQITTLQPKAFVLSYEFEPQVQHRRHVLMGTQELAHCVDRWRLRSFPHSLRGPHHVQATQTDNSSEGC